MEQSHDNRYANWTTWMQRSYKAGRYEEAALYLMMIEFHFPRIHTATNYYSPRIEEAIKQKHKNLIDKGMYDFAEKQGAIYKHLRRASIDDVYQATQDFLGVDLSTIPVATQVMAMFYNRISEMLSTYKPIWDIEVDTVHLKTLRRNSDNTCRYHHSKRIKYPVFSSSIFIKLLAILRNVHNWNNIVIYQNNRESVSLYRWYQDCEFQKDKIWISTYEKGVGRDWQCRGDIINQKIIDGYVSSYSVDWLTTNTVVDMIVPYYT